MDDYIHTTDTIVNYLTEFSGIRCKFRHFKPPCHELTFTVSRGSGSFNVQTYTAASENRVQETSSSRRPWLHFRGSRIAKGLPHNQCVLDVLACWDVYQLIWPDLFVPPEQVLDTVDLYFIKERQRRLSLRFLSWYVLKEPIQGVTHDSIEDARAALLLYQKYQEHESEGTFDELLEEIYREGKKTVSGFLLVLHVLI